MSDIAMFPLWRMNSTPAEKLAELAQYAALRPENIVDVIVLYADSDGFRQVAVDSKMKVSDAVYALEQAKFDMLKEM